PTPFLALAPQTSASTNSAILASEGMFPYLLLLRRRSRLRGRRLRGRRTRNRLRRRSGYRLRRFRRGGLAPRVEDARRRVPAGKISQRQRRDHENDRHSGREPREKIPRAAAAEDRRAGAAEDGAHLRAFAGLQEHDQDEADADDNMDNGYCDYHMTIEMPARFSENRPPEGSPRRQEIRRALGPPPAPPRFPA